MYIYSAYAKSPNAIVSTKTKNTYITAAGELGVWNEKRGEREWAAAISLSTSFKMNK